MLTNEEYQNNNIRYLFNEWENHFENIPNMNCFHTDRQNAFLQFWNGRNADNNTHVKLYFNFSKENIYECINKVFEFMANNNIDSRSKVANKIRSDSCVLRLNSIEDAEKVIRFVNNNEFLVQNARPTNPFLIKEGIVGMAYDGSLSFNDTISILLEDYFKQCKEYNSLNNVSMKNFRNFVITYKENYFRNESNIKCLKNIEHYCDMDNKSLIANNYEQVLNLIINSLDNDINFDKYKNLYTKFKQTLTNETKNQYYENIINGKVNNTLEDTMELKNVNDSVTILNNYIKYAVQKYGSINNMIDYLTSYINTGSTTTITRDNNFRKLFEEHNITPSFIKQVTNNNIFEYVNKLLIKKNYDDNYQYFYNACIETYKKYGYQQLYAAIRNGLEGNFSHFTNSNGQNRTQLEMHFDKQLFYICSTMMANTTDITLIAANCCNAIQNSLNFNMQQGKSI